jgi:hypothetical protein
MSEEQVTQQQSVESNTQETQQQDTQAKPFEIPTEAQDLVGEGKKYSKCRRSVKICASCSESYSDFRV